jgi:hypothetical protein
MKLTRAISPLILFVLFSPLAARPVSFARFDKMPLEMQPEFVATMIDVTERTLREHGETAAADKMAPPFSNVLEGDTMPLGLVELERNIDRVRLFDLEGAQKDPKAERFDVEDALFVTLKKNGIEISDKTQNDVLSILTNFHAMTYAEFQSMPAPDQRRFLSRMAQVGLPDYELRDRVHKMMPKEEVSDPQRYKETLLLELEVIHTNFPSGSGGQPGFDAIARKVRTESATHPNDPGPFYELVMYVLGETDAVVAKRMREMDNTTYHLPEHPKPPQKP